MWSTSRTKQAALHFKYIHVNTSRSQSQEFKSSISNRSEELSRASWPGLNGRNREKITFSRTTDWWSWIPDSGEASKFSSTKFFLPIVWETSPFCPNPFQYLCACSPDWLHKSLPLAAPLSPWFPVPPHLENIHSAPWPFLIPSQFVVSIFLCKVQILP